MLTETLTIVLSTAAVTSIPWFIAYHSQTGYLKELHCGVFEQLKASRSYAELVANERDDALTKLAAEKVETENLAETCDMLRKANIRLMDERDQANAKLAPFITPRKRDARGHFISEAA